jgi:dolichol-phosphate mannosyltransferase
LEKVILIIPTYNEKNNIGPILDRLLAVFDGIKNYEMGILVYDSNSPDGTADIVKSYQQKYPNIYLQIEEKKSGLGNAYIQAMKYACNTLHADIVFEFDADGSHDPKYIPDMMKAFSNGADVVLGSRYVPGGSIPKDWALHRKLLSVLGNWAARIVLSHKIKDYTTGYRGTRTELLKTIDLDNLKSKGYAYKIHLMWLLHQKKACIVELPIDFVDRQEGYSKLPKNNMIESLWLIFYLRFLQLQQYIKVCAVGAIGVVIQLLFFNWFRHFWHPAYANILSVEIAVIVNFIMNNYYTFAEDKFLLRDQLSQSLKKLGLFNFLSLGSMLIQTVVIFIGVDVIGRSGILENIYVIIGIGIGSIYNYKMYRHVVWKRG